MILVTVTHERGIELATARVIAIDPEKIVSVRTRNGVAEIDYGESYVRNRETITYRLTANAANISATIQGDYVGKVYLALTVVFADNRDIRPELGTTSYTLDLCEKYIVDIEETVLFYAGAKHDVTKIRYIPASFVPETIYVSQEIERLVTDTPSETTTTTTPEVTTTTTWEDLCQEPFYNGTLTVGVNGQISGYSSGEGAIGSISPSSEFLTALWYNDASNELLLALVGQPCYQVVTVYIDGVEYTLSLLSWDEAMSSYTLSEVAESPLPDEDESCNIQVCFGDECTTTTTEEATTTTTVVYDEIYLSNFYYVGAPPPVTPYGETLESACEVVGMAESVTLMYNWCYLVPDGMGSFYVYSHFEHTLMAEGYYIYFDGEDYVIYYVDENGITDLTPVECETTTTTTLQ